MSLDDISAIFKDFTECNDIKYAAYRTAVKMRILQKKLKMHLINIGDVIHALEDYGLVRKDNTFCVSRLEIDEFLNDMYKTTARKLGFVEDPTKLASLLTFFLLKMFPNDSKLQLPFFQLKTFLILFCSSKLSDKYRNIFRHFSFKGHITNENLYVMFECLAKVPELLGEKLSFGSHFITAAIKSCINFCQGLEHVTEANFLLWLSCEPQSLVWLSTFFRICMSEKVQHDTKCEVCKSNPIQGLRYKCLSCLSYNLCQNCFFKGFANKSHKIKHPVQEFSQRATSWEKIRSVLIILKNKLPTVQYYSKTYLSFDDCPLPYECTAESSEVECKVNNNSATPLQVPTSFLIKELSCIICKLEKESRQILDEIQLLHEIQNTSTEGCTSEGACRHKSIILMRQEALQDHSYHLQQQLYRLKDLLSSLQPCRFDREVSNQNFVSPLPNIPVNKIADHFESTPIVENTETTNPVHIEKFMKFKAELETLEDIFRKTLNSDSSGSSVSDVQKVDKNEVPQFMSNADKLNKAVELSRVVSVKHLSADTNKKKSFQVFPADSVTKAEELEMELKSSYLFSDSIEEELFNSQKTTEKNTSFTDVTPESSSYTLAALSKYTSYDTFNKNDSTEVEAELQVILEQLENLFPKLTDLQRSVTFKKEKVLDALSEVEEAMKKLSSPSIVADISHL